MLSRDMVDKRFFLCRSCFEEGTIGRRGDKDAILMADGDKVNPAQIEEELFSIDWISSR